MSRVFLELAVTGREFDCGTGTDPLPAMADVARSTDGRLVSFWAGLPSSALSAALLPACDAVGFGVTADGAGVLEGAVEEVGWTALDWDRCRMASSEGFLRWSLLLEARWPGVWLRCAGAGGASEASESFEDSDSSAVAKGVVVGMIFCERMTRDFCGDCGVEPAEDLADSPIVMLDADHCRGH